jgi:hypothetical protein
MPSTAISSQGTVLYVGTTTGGAKTITAATQANPGVITATAHGFSNGDIVTIAGIVGMTQLNGNNYIVQYKTTNTFSLANTDTTSFTVYGSAGTATPLQWQSVGNMKTFSGLDGQASEIDVSNFASTGKEFILGLYDGGMLKCDLDIDNSDLGQQALRTALQGSAKKNFKLTLPSGTTPNVTFAGFVKQFNITGGVDQVVKGSITLRISGGYTLS